MKRQRTYRVGFAGLALAAVAGFQAPGYQDAAGDAASVSGASPAGALVDQYCTGCHNEQLKTGGLALDLANAEDVAQSAEVWEKVIGKLRSRSMPPPGMPRPENARYDEVAGWLEAELDQAAAAHPNPGRMASLHRLNRAEYGNAIRDLLGVQVNPLDLLPPDEQAFGFENNAEALTIQPALLDRYVSAAAFISRQAVGDPSMPPAFVRYGAMKNNANDLTYLSQAQRLSEEFPLGSKGGVATMHYFPVDGEYVFRLKLQRSWSNVIRGLNVETQFEVRVDGERVGQFRLGGEEKPTETFLYDGDEGLQVRVPVKAGLRKVMATMLKVDDSAPEGGGADRLSPYSRSADSARTPVAIASLWIGGPYDGKVPETSPSRERVFICQPETQADEAPCARKILRNLTQRGYRRAATEEDVETLYAFFEQGRENGTFDNGIRSALERLLISPDFLFRIEADPAGVAPGSVYRVSDVELASRLSFALWASIPDNELLGLAIDDRLHEPAVLEQQVKRMFADPRTRSALLDNFFNDWLQVRNVWLLNPDSTKFPFFDDNLRTALVTETELFLEDQLKQDHSIFDLLNSDETFLNEKLARHYGIEGVYGSHFRRVKLADENRFGLLGKGSILAISSYTTRTSPTIRGKWLLENILASPPPAPPPNVPALEESNTSGEQLTVRALLEVHRKNPVCASCHQRMDPLGLSLENFDAIGRWRDLDAGQPIDASGVLPNGVEVSGPRELREALAAQQTLFARAVIEKLLTYMLGRGLQYYDAPAVREIERAAARDDYRWSAMVDAVVKSVPFQMRTAAD